MRRSRATRARSRRSSALRTLADAAGILPEYVDQAGAIQRTSDRARIGILAALGLPADTDARARQSLDALSRVNAAQLIAPCRVVRDGARTIPLRPPGTGPWRWQLDVACEGTEPHRSEGTLRTGRGAPAIRLRVAPGLGYHRVTLRLTGRDGVERTAEQTLIVVPARCASPADLGVTRGFGLLANLYTLRTPRNWGVGDLTDLCDLVRFAAAHGGAFVGINPLHALGNVGDEISPYQPISRLYRNPLYLDVTAVPELLESPDAQALLARPETRAAVARLRAGDRVDYAAVMAEKERVLRALHRAFAARHRGHGTARGDAYERYRDAEGEALVDFATFVALRARLSAGDPALRDWRRWSAGYRDRVSRDVEAFRAEHTEDVDYQSFLQFELDRQLACAAERARADGLAVGVYQDLALGSSPIGADPWAFPGLFLDGASVGAPPDPFAPTGQNWGLPPIAPAALARGGYAYWIRLVRGAMRHAGAIRIDHVMGLFRQFWIPTGCSGADGAYVRMPADDLLGILALESVRARALVIGEDLGTVPAGLPRELARWGVLSMRVLYFMRDARGAFLPARRYPARALVSANTHDMAPLAGWLEGRDLALRRRVGQIPTDHALADAERERERERRALLARLAREGIRRSKTDRAGGRRSSAAAPATPPDAELRGAVHEFLARTPAVMVGVALDDLAGEHDPVNLPGVPLEAYPSWTRKMRPALDDLMADPDVERALDVVPRLRGRAPRATAARRRLRARGAAATTARRSRPRRRARSRGR